MKKRKFFTFLCIALFILSCVDKSKITPVEKPYTSKTSKEIDSSTPIFSILNPLQSGINFVNELTETADMNGFFYEYYYNGAGVSISDINNDGLKDVLFLSNLRKNQLYLNKGNLKFDDITQSSGLMESTGYRTGVTNVDINSDGFMDFYISKSGKYEDSSKRRNELWINQGLNTSGIPTFKEEASKYNLDIDMCSTQAAFFDYDLDGDLDMFLINHYTTPFNYAEVDELIGKEGILTGDRLFNNQNGKFIDVTKNAGLTNTNRLSYALGLSVGDLNNDGWPDVYVANDYEGKDYLYLNNKNGTFTDVANQATNHTSLYSMGTDIGDLNNDGWLDFISLDMMAEDNYTMKTSMSAMNAEKFDDVVAKGLNYQYMFNTVQINNGVTGNQSIPIFSDVAQLSGMAMTDWSWGPLIFDMDNDGYNDVFISNGIKRDFRNNDFIIKQKTRPDTVETKNRDVFIKTVLNEMPERKKQNYFFKNNGDLSFSNKNGKWLLDISSSSNGAAYGDLDNDGDLDLVVNNADDVSLIYRNNTAELKLGNFLKIKLIGPEKNPNAIGARVRLYNGSSIQTKEHYHTRGFQSSVGNGLHFGLNKEKTIDQLIVTWPDGKIQELKNVLGNQEVIINYREARTYENRQEKSTNDNQIFTSLNGNDFRVDWVHKENNFNDFKRESLLPHKMSNLGPALAVGDINEDQLDDFFVGGAKDQNPMLFIQLPNGSFKPDQTEMFKDQSSFEDIDAQFFDADNDGDLDLYVVSGGNEWTNDSRFYQDRFFVNKDGMFSYVKDAIPQLTASGSKALPFDFDSDGDLDIFIAGRQIPGLYPSPANSHILRNDSSRNNIKFTDVTDLVFPQLNNIGMVTDALVIDVDDDGRKDIVLVGEWMSLRLFRNMTDTFTEVSNEYGLDNTNGWWNTIKAADFDNDGDVDLVAGNLGLNYKYKATTEKSFNVYGDDFDKNGTFDIVLGYYEGDNLFPLRGRQCTSEQMPFIKKKFPTYEAFGKASLEDVYGKEKLNNAIKYSAQTFATTYFENLGNGTFVGLPLGNMAQITSVNDMAIEDFDNDGNLDIVLAGNLYGSEVETPRNDAGSGLFMKGDGVGGFTSIPMYKSGLYIPGETRQIKKIRIDNEKALLFARNNDSLKIIKFR